MLRRSNIHYLPNRAQLIECDKIYIKENTSTYRIGFNPKCNIIFHPVFGDRIENLPITGFDNVYYL